MIIAVTAQGDSLESPIDSRFGRCSFFVLVNPDDMSYDTAANDNARQGGGAGIASAQFIADKGCDAVITGNCGPNAFRVCEAASIKVFTGAHGSVREAIGQYKSGSLQTSDKANVGSHYGTR